MSPLLRLWKNARHASATRQAKVKRPLQSRFRPRLESLEDRLAPATTLTWTGGGASPMADDPNNWAEHRTPIMMIPIFGGSGPEYFDLIFPRVSNKVCDFSGHVMAVNSITFFDAGYTIRGGGMDLGKPGITSAAGGGTNTIEGVQVTLDQQEPNSEPIPIDVRSNNILRLTSDIVDHGALVDDIPPRELVQKGAGTLFLSGNNSYSGGYYLQQGTLIVGSNTALGSGTLLLYGGTIQSSNDVNLANPVDVISQSGNVSGGNNIMFTGSVMIHPFATLTVANNFGFVAFNSVIFGRGNVVKEGAGDLILHGVNTYEGGTDLRVGNLIVDNGSLGSGELSLTGGRLANGDFNAAATVVPNHFQVSGGTIQNAVNAPFNFTGPSTILAGGTLTVAAFGSGSITFSESLGGEGGLTKDGDGQVTFTGDKANLYTGATTVIDGTLFLKKPDGVNAIAGPLVIGDGVGDPRSAVVSLGAPNQIADTAPVTVKTDGLLKQNTNSEKIKLLTNKGKATSGDPPTLTVAFDDLTATFEGEIEGPGIVVKDGTGTWILSGVNTYTGGTIVNGGKLLVDGSIIGQVTVNAGATLGGTGATGPVTLAEGAAISPGGAAPGTQKVQDLAFSTGTSFVVQLNGPDPGTGYDQLDVTGTVSLNDATLDASLGFSPAPGGNFVIIKNDGADPVIGTFAGLPQGAVVSIGGVAFHIYYDRGDGNDVVLIRNTPPAVTVPGDQTAFQNVDLALGGVRVDDPEDATLSVALQVSHGTLTLGTVAGLTISGNGTTSVSLLGSQADLNAALAGLLYRGDHNYSGPEVLTVTASDGLETTSDTVAIRVKSLAELAADMQAQVNALRAAGVLNQGQASSLVVKLDLKDNDGDIGRVQAFLNEVDALLRASILSSAQADALRTSGNTLLTGLERR